MNQVVKSLWRKSRLGYNEQVVDPMVLDEFTALLIKEVCAILRNDSDDTTSAALTVSKIKSHFGVE